MDLVNKSSRHTQVFKKRDVFKYRSRQDDIDGIQREILNRLPENGKNWLIEDYSIVGTDCHYIAKTVR